MISFRHWVVSFALMVGCLACAPSGPSDELKAQVVSNYADIVLANYQDNYAAAQSLQVAVAAFLEAPSAEGLAEARRRWLDAREPYGQSEAFRFYGGPIDAADGPEPLINAWPLDEGYIDFVEGAPTSGIIGAIDRHPDLSAAVLTRLNEQGAEENVSVGFHAIEFLLWGQDLSATGPGARSFEDYLETGLASNAARRSEYLTLVTKLLVDHLGQLVAEWEPSGKDNYRAGFLTQSSDRALQAMLTGVGVLAKSELAGERMFTALDNRDQEDEHSCFSDNTHRDIVTNALGIQNVLLGRYRRLDGSLVEGPSVIDAVAQSDDALAAALRAHGNLALEGVEAINAPFDQAIIDPAQREVVLSAVYRLQDQGDKIAEAAGVLGLVINTALPE